MTANHSEKDTLPLKGAFLKAALPQGFTFDDLAAKPGLKLENGFSALSSFIWNDYLTVAGLRHLHERGIDLHAVDTAGNIPLFYVICDNRKDIFDFLMATEGAFHVNRLQESRTDKKSLLHWAVAHNNLEFAEKLIAAGAHINAIDRDNHSPLAKAVINNNEKMIRLLVKAGSDVAKYESETGIKLLTLMHPMVLAEVAGPPEDRIVTLLIEQGANPAAANAHGVPLIAHYAERNRVHIVDALAKAGAPLDKSGSGASDYTALIHAVIHSNHAMVDALLEAGADPNATTPYADLPFMYALRREDFAICEKLIKGGARLDAARDNGATLLCQTVMSNLPLHLVEYLLEAGANPNVMSFNLDGLRRPLHIAAGQQRLDCIQMLLEYGANPLLPDVHGVMPLEHAIKRLGPGHAVTECLRAATKAASMGNQNLLIAKKTVKNRRTQGGIILP